MDQIKTLFADSVVLQLNIFSMIVQDFEGGNFPIFFSEIIVKHHHPKKEPLKSTTKYGILVV